MKNEIKKFIIENNLLYPNYNRNIARKKYWDKRNVEWSNYTLCSCGSKKIFASQGLGYKKTCGRVNCINISKNKNHFNNNEFNIRTSKGGSSFDNGFLYVLKSDFHDFVKIGITQDPVSRLSSLRKNINDFRIVDCFWLNENLSKIEKELHNIFKLKKVIFDDTFDGYSEIFYLDNIDITYIKDCIYDKIK